MPQQRYDVFIYHVSEDDEAIAPCRASALRKKELSVEREDLETMNAAELRREIESRIGHATLGVVILSDRLLAEPYTGRELDNMVAMPHNGKQGILPISHKLHLDRIMEKSPLLANSIMRSTSDATVEERANEISQVVHDHKRYTTRHTAPVTEEIIMSRE